MEHDSQAQPAAHERHFPSVSSGRVEEPHLPGARIRPGGGPT